MNTKPLNKGTACVLIVCNEASTAPVWGYMIREKKLHAIIETMPKNAEKYCVEKAPALIILDLQLPPLKILDICHKLRGTCENPILLFLPSYDENLILEYYDAGIDDCVVKPISPVVFYAKVRAWLRHSKRLPVDAMLEVQVWGYLPESRSKFADNGQWKASQADRSGGTLSIPVDEQPGPGIRWRFDCQPGVGIVWGAGCQPDQTCCLSPAP